MLTIILFVTAVTLGCVLHMQHHFWAMRRDLAELERMYTKIYLQLARRLGLVREEGIQDIYAEGDSNK